MSYHGKSSRTPSARGHARPRDGPRSPQACVNCKERKLKCDTQAPACSNCRRFELVCLVEDPISKCLRPRNYIQTLENRVAVLECILQQTGQGAAVASDHLVPHDGFRPPQTPAGQSAYGTALSTAMEPHDEDPDAVGNLASRVGLLGLDAPGAEPHYYGSSSHFAFSRLINGSLRHVSAPRPSNPFCWNQPTVVDPLPCPLPDYETAVMLSDAYFKHVNSQYPFLHQATFREWEVALLSPSEEGSMPIDPSPVPHFFLNMVYAVGALLLPNCGYLAEQLYVSAALYIDHMLAMDSLETIQALLCCAMYSIRSQAGPSVWRLTGLGLRYCIELGYHRSPAKIGLSTTNPLQAEMRKRVFWCVYGMDIAAAVTLGRPLSIALHDVDAEFPLDIDETSITSTAVKGSPRATATDPPTSMSRAIHTFRLRRIWASIITSLYSGSSSRDPAVCAEVTEQLRTRLDEWLASVPPIPDALNGPSLAVFSSNDWFELTYHHSLLLLYRDQLMRSSSGGSGGIIGGGGSVGGAGNSVNTSDDIFFKCSHAAQNTIRLYRRQYVGQRTSCTWGAVHLLLLAGLTYLHCLWTSPALRHATRQDEVSSTCTDCTMVLVMVGERWEAAAPYRDIFEGLASRTMTMMVDHHFAKSNAGGEGGRGLDAGDVAQWMADIVSTGMHEGTDSLVACLTGHLSQPQ